MDRAIDARLRVLELTAPLVRALRNVNLDDYSLIVGDDTSGRIPALIVRNMAKQPGGSRRSRKIPTTFIQSAWISPRSPFLGRMREEWARREPTWRVARGKRALVVTDFICTGEHIQHLGTLLKASGIDYDVLAVGSYLSESEMISRGLIKKGTRLFRGVRTIPRIYTQDSRISGLSRAKFLEHPVVRDVEIRRCVVASRVAADEVVQQVRLGLQGKRIHPQRQRIVPQSLPSPYLRAIKRRAALGLKAPEVAL